jgi:hypothetical protein
MQQSPRVARPNKPIQPTPLRGLKIAAILKAGCAQQLSRSTSPARLMGKPLGRNPTLVDTQVGANERGWCQ